MRLAAIATLALILGLAAGLALGHGPLARTPAVAPATDALTREDAPPTVAAPGHRSDEHVAVAADAPAPPSPAPASALARTPLARLADALQALLAGLTPTAWPEHVTFAALPLEEAPGLPTSEDALASAAGGAPPDLASSLILRVRAPDGLPPRRLAARVEVRRERDAAAWAEERIDLPSGRDGRTDLALSPTTWEAMRGEGPGGSSRLLLRAEQGYGAIDLPPAVAPGAELTAWLAPAARLRVHVSRGDAAAPAGVVVISREWPDTPGPWTRAVEGRIALFSGLPAGRAEVLLAAAEGGAGHVVLARAEVTLASGDNDLALAAPPATTTTIAAPRTGKVVLWQRLPDGVYGTALERRTDDRGRAHFRLAPGEHVALFRPERAGTLDPGASLCAGRRSTAFHVPSAGEVRVGEEDGE